MYHIRIKHSNQLPMNAGTFFYKGISIEVIELPMLNNMTQSSSLASGYFKENILIIEEKNKNIYFNSLFSLCMSV